MTLVGEKKKTHIQREEIFNLFTNHTHFLIIYTLLGLQELCLRRNPFDWPGTSR